MIRNSSKYIHRQIPPNLQNTSPDCANFAFEIPILCRICIMNPQIPQNLQNESPLCANFAVGLISHNSNARQYNHHNYKYFLLYIIQGIHTIIIILS